jgi:hypothetical protein
MSKNPEDLSDCTKEEIEAVNEFNECLKQFKEPSKTKIEKVLDFETELDEWVWKRLPLSGKQKEQLLYEIFVENKSVVTSSQDYVKRYRLTIYISNLM